MSPLDRVSVLSPLMTVILPATTVRCSWVPLVCGLLSKESPALNSNSYISSFPTSSGGDRMRTRHPDPLMFIVGTSPPRKTAIWDFSDRFSNRPAKSTCKARVRFQRVEIVGLLSPRSIWLRQRLLLARLLKFHRQLGQYSVVVIRHSGNLDDRGGMVKVKKRDMKKGPAMARPFCILMICNEA